MLPIERSSLAARARLVVAGLVLATAACTQTPVPADDSDPFVSASSELVVGPSCAGSPVCTATGPRNVHSASLRVGSSLTSRGELLQVISVAGTGTPGTVSLLARHLRRFSVPQAQGPVRLHVAIFETPAGLTPVVPDASAYLAEGTVDLNTFRADGATLPVEFPGDVAAVPLTATGLVEAGHSYAVHVWTDVLSAGATDTVLVGIGTLVTSSYAGGNLYRRTLRKAGSVWGDVRLQPALESPAYLALDFAPANVTCSALDACHDVGIYSPALGACTNPAKADGTACNDAVACTENDVCTAGTCGGTTYACGPVPACHEAGTCNGDGTCAFVPVTDGTACDDANACTQVDSCDAGACVGASPVTCSPLDQCHAVGTCDPGTGTCSNPNKANGSSCDDGNACTQVDSCSAGVCSGGSPVVCTPLDSCHSAGTCNVSTGTCSQPVLADGTSCDDGLTCTTADTCSAGSCAGQPGGCTTDPARLAAGNGFTCAITSGGDVKCWGLNTDGALGDGTTLLRFEPVKVPLGAAATGVTAGFGHACALLSGGTVKCWGLNGNGQLGNNTLTDSYTPVNVLSAAAGPPLSGVTAISAGQYHTCAVLSNGTAKCWGQGVYGQLGDGTTNQRLVPNTVLTTGSVALTGVTGIAGGMLHSCALASGNVYCWGGNGTTLGELGDGVLTAHNLAQPTSALGATAVQVVAAPFSRHSCAVLSTGSMKCWGHNQFGKLGLGHTTTPQSSPSTVVTISTVASASAGQDHTCAVLTNGSVYCWGLNISGQTGNGNTTSPQSSPVQAIGIATAVRVSVGVGHACARLADGTVRCWGVGTNGQLGDLSTNAQSTPLAALAFPCSLGGTSTNDCAVCTPTTCAASGATSGTISDGCGGTLFCGAAQAPKIATGQSFTCAVASDATARCWGTNGTGQVGDGNSATPRASPSTVSGLTGVTSIAAGQGFACAIHGASKQVSCWGANTNSQLGDGLTATRNTPYPIPGLTNVAQVAAGNTHACARFTSGAVSCWGSNAFGQYGNGTSTSSTTPLAITNLSNVSDLSAGANATCFVFANGLVRCAGHNASGKLGNGSAISQFTLPVVAKDVQGAVQVAQSASGDFSCARLASGAVSCWGANGSGQLGDNTSTAHAPAPVTGLSTATLISLGNSHTCATLASGGAQCWGNNGSGRLGDGTTTNPQRLPVNVVGLSTVTQVSGGSSHTCATVSSGARYCWGTNSNDEFGVGSTTPATSNTPVLVTAF